MLGLWVWKSSDLQEWMWNRMHWFLCLDVFFTCLCSWSNTLLNERWVAFVVVVRNAATWRHSRTSNRVVLRLSVQTHTMWGCVQISNFLHTIGNKKEINSGCQIVSELRPTRGFFYFEQLCWDVDKGAPVCLGSSWLVHLIIFLSSEACYILSGRNATNERGLLWNNQRKQKGAGQATVTLREEQTSRMGGASQWSVSHSHNKLKWQIGINRWWITQHI